MTKREKILAAAVLGLLVLWGARVLLGRSTDLIDRRETQLLEAKKQVFDAEMALARGSQAVKKLEAWQDQSLPADRDVTMSLYRSWLLERCKSAGLTVDDVKPDARSARTAAYSSVGYAVEARGSLQSVASLMYEFYRSNLLQQITRLRLRPSPDSGGQLSVSLRVEALILPGATNSDRLPDGTSDRLALAGVDEYRKQLVERNVFVSYTPPQAERTTEVARTQPPPPQFDAAKHAYVTGIVQTGDKLQAWITVRTTGEVLRLFEGDELKVGLLEGRILSIAPRTVVVQAGDEQFQVQLGHSLREEDKETGSQGNKETT